MIPRKCPCKIHFNTQCPRLRQPWVENLVKAKKKYDGDDDESMFVAAKMIEGESELVVVSLWHDLF